MPKSKYVRKKGTAHFQELRLPVKQAHLPPGMQYHEQERLMIATAPETYMIDVGLSQSTTLG